MHRAWLVLLSFALLAGCATLREDVPRVASQALPPDPAAPLAVVAQGVTAAGTPSAFRLLEAGHDALAARLALAVLRQLRGQGPRVRILTNSPAANDVLLAHAGYARYRP